MLKLNKFKIYFIAIKIIFKPIYIYYAMRILKIIP